MSEVGLYVAIAAGVIALLAIGAGILYYKHRQDIKHRQIHERIIRERLQHVVENNLPPFYSDHELDPVAIYDHELPPDVVPATEPIIVQSASDDLVILPEEDPLVTSPSFLRSLSNPLMATTHSSPIMAALAGTTTTTTTAVATTATAGAEPIVLSNAISDETGALDSNTVSLAIGSATPSPSAQPLARSPALLPRSSSSSFHSMNGDSNLLTTRPSLSSLSSAHTRDMPIATPAAALLSPMPQTPIMTPLPPITPEELLDLAQLPPPPHYDVLNRIVDRSPMVELTSFNFGSPMPLSTSPQVPLATATDYFGQHRARSHTFSHPPPPASVHHHLYQQHLHHSQSHVGIHQEQSLPPTPRYSLEFPSHIPHEQHLERYQRARASSFRVETPPLSEAENSPHMLHLQGRSLSQPGYYQPSIDASHLSDSQGSSINSGRRRRIPGGARSRSSTLGDSSKLLLQRVHSLWKKSLVANGVAVADAGASASASASASGSSTPTGGQSVDADRALSSPSSSAPSVPSSVYQLEVNPVGHGLGLSFDRDEQDNSSQSDASSVVVIVPEQDEASMPSLSSALSASSPVPSSASTFSSRQDEQAKDEEVDEAGTTIDGENDASSSTDLSLASLSLDSPMHVHVQIFMPLAVS
ncbi:hypothetical protein BGZ94_008171 [Podila epigama]|nr:hypothetical protein BGZ94_008171 [Podila epigama]